MGYEELSNRVSASREECIDCLLQKEIRGAAPLAHVAPPSRYALIRATSLAARPLGDFVSITTKRNCCSMALFVGRRLASRKRKTTKTSQNRERLRGFPIPLKRIAENRFGQIKDCSATRRSV